MYVNLNTNKIIEKKLNFFVLIYENHISDCWHASIF